MRSGWVSSFSHYHRTVGFGWICRNMFHQCAKVNDPPGGFDFVVWWGKGRSHVTGNEPLGSRKVVRKSSAHPTFRRTRFSSWSSCKPSWISSPLAAWVVPGRQGRVLPAAWGQSVFNSCQRIVCFAALSGGEAGTFWRVWRTASSCCRVSIVYHSKRVAHVCAFAPVRHMDLRSKNAEGDIWFHQHIITSLIYTSSWVGSVYWMFMVSNECLWFPSVAGMLPLHDMHWEHQCKQVLEMMRLVSVVCAQFLKVDSRLSTLPLSL